MSNISPAVSSRSARDRAPVEPDRQPGAASAGENPLLVMVRALARSEAQRMFLQEHEQGRVSIAVTVAMAVLALVALVVFLGVFR